MTDKEIVLELTKATASKAVAEIFNTIAENIKPALDKLKDHN